MHRGTGFLVGLACGALLLAACGKSSTTSTSTSMSMSSSTAAGTANYGTPGDASMADQTITVQILASRKYDPASMSVRPGETVVFKVTNMGSSIHEFVLGDSKTQDAYDKAMADMSSSPMNMPDRSNIIDMQPGVTKTLAWTFPSVSGTTVIYGSHQPGDYAGGLRGVITVTGTPVSPSSGGTQSPTTMGGMGTSTTVSGSTPTTMGNMPGMETTTTMH